MRCRQAAVIGQNATTIQGFGARYGQTRRAARGNALSYTGRTLVLHGESACPTRMVSLSYTEKRIFPLHGAEGVTQGNSTDPLRLTKSGGMPNWARWRQLHKMVFGNYKDAICHALPQSHNDRPKCGRDSGFRGERTSLGLNVAFWPTQPKTGQKQGLFQTECAIPAVIRRFCTHMDSVQRQFCGNEGPTGGL